MQMNRTVLAVTALCLALAGALAGCHWNSHGTQRGPRVLRVETVPGGATLTVVRTNLRVTTPCDLTDSADPDDEVVISLDGYASFRGVLRQLPRSATGTYRLRLVEQK